MRDRTGIAGWLSGIPWGTGAALLWALSGAPAWECAAASLTAFSCMSAAGRSLLSPACLLLVAAGTAFTEGSLFLAAAAVSGLVFAERFAGRALLALSVPLAFQASGSTPLAALGALAVLCALPGSRRIRLAGVSAGIPLIMVLAGPPLPGEDAEILVQEHISNGDFSWDRFHLDMSGPRALLRTPYPAQGRMTMVCEGGGTRDSMPVGLVFSGEAVYTIPSGASTLEFPLSGGFVEILMIRDFRPFEHPVLHIVEACANAVN